MFQQIMVSDEDIQLQRIFWRSNSSDPLCVCKLNTITYGTSCAPFLALGTIKQQLSLDEEKNFPTAVTAACEHMYVGDFLGRSHSVDSAQVLVTYLQNLVQSDKISFKKMSVQLQRCSCTFA